MKWQFLAEAQRYFLMKMTYPGLESQEDFGKKQNDAFESNGDILQDKVSDAHHPDEIEEVKAVDVWLRKHKAERQQCPTVRRKKKEKKTTHGSK